MKLDLLGASDIADLLGVSRQRVHAIVRTHAEFPEPIGEIKAGKVWLRSDIEEWSHRYRPSD